VTGPAGQAAPQAPALPLTGITVVALLAAADVFGQNLAPGARPNASA
jgi:hypothetical protein